MHITERIIALLTPYECLGCGREPGLICKACGDALPKLVERCYRCHRMQAASQTCIPCRSSSHLYRAQAVAHYDGLAKDLVWRLKFGAAQAVATDMARLMGRLLPVADNMYITPVPTATSRARARGYDQAALLAKALARSHKLTYFPCLARHGQAHQVGANRRDRLRQLVGAFRVKQRYQVQGAHIILIDDVLTTGATLESAATVLRAAGAKRVEAIVFAQA